MGVKIDESCNSGNIPVLSVEAEVIPEAWEKAVLAVWDNGVSIKTEYDKLESPSSRDATVMVAVKNPFGEPRIHKNFPGGPEELEAYRQEVVNGIHDHWVRPQDGKWTYTYHERLFSYSPTSDLSSSEIPRLFSSVDQIEYIIDKLSESGHSRRAQAITWMPTADPETDDPPCLQRVWCRLVSDERSQEDGRFVLNMNTHWRSRDLYKAWFMNVYAMTDLQRVIAERIAEKRSEPVRVGRYVDVSDSLHIYGDYFEEVEPEIRKMRKSSYAERAWNTTHPAFAMMTEEAREKLAQDPDYYAKADSEK